MNHYRSLLDVSLYVAALTTFVLSGEVCACAYLTGKPEVFQLALKYGAWQDGLLLIACFLHFRYSSSHPRVAALRVAPLLACAVLTVYELLHSPDLADFGALDFSDHVVLGIFMLALGGILAGMCMRGMGYVRAANAALAPRNIVYTATVRKRNSQPVCNERSFVDR